MLRYLSIVGLLLLVTGLSDAIPKYESGKPSSYQENQWRRTYYDENNKQNETYAADESVNKERLQRLGYTTGYGGINGYPHSGSGVTAYSPVKLDLGGVVLGTLVGIGAILILPKLINIFTGGYGHYGRSEDGGDLTAITDMLSKIDDILGQNNIDSTSCMQRAVCSYIRSSETNLQSGASDQIDVLIHALADNSMVDYMIDGTAVKEALENGKNTKGKDCKSLYPTCPLDSNSAMKILTKLLPKNSQ